MAKNRATGYSDFYKGRPSPEQSPGSIAKTPGYGIPEKEEETAAKLKKEALKRRLKRTSSAMKAKSQRAR